MSAVAEHPRGARTSSSTSSSSSRASARQWRATAASWRSRRRGARRRREAPAAVARLPHCAAGSGAARRRRRRGRARPHGEPRARRPHRRRLRPSRTRVGLVARSGRRRARGGRLPLRARVRGAGRYWATSAAWPCWPTRASASRAARPCSARRRTTPTRPCTPTWSGARSRPGSSSRRRACSAAGDGRSRSSGSRWASPSRSPTTSSTARADALETGKVAGTDLREGTPTLPLLLAARSDPAVRTGARGRAAGRRARARGRVGGARPVAPPGRSLRGAGPAGAEATTRARPISPR